MNWWLLIIIPVTSAFIGRMTIQLAVKLLFRTFPKRQPQIAQQTGAWVSKELVSFPELEAKITSEDNIKKIMPVAQHHIDDFLRNKLNIAFPMIGMFIGEKTIGTLKEIFMKELETIFPVILKGYMQNLQNDFNPEQLIADKIAAIPPEKIEAGMRDGLKKEIRLAGLLFGFIGLLIGLLQVGIIYLLQ